MHDAWSRGKVPVWWDAISGGRPLLPNPNAGVFYPVRMALAGVAFPEAMRLFPIVHWILGGWGMLALMRVCGGSRAAAWVAAASFAFSGVLVSEVFYFNFLPGAALLPWSLWALARRPPGRLARIVPIAVVYGLMLLAGDAFSLVIAAASAVLWILLETAREERASRALELLAGLAGRGPAGASADRRHGAGGARDAPNGQRIPTPGSPDLLGAPRAAARARGAVSLRARVVDGSLPRLGRGGLPEILHDAVRRADRPDRDPPDVPGQSAGRAVRARARRAVRSRSPSPAASFRTPGAP